MSSTFRKSLKRSALTVALGLCFVGAVQAQSTTGNIYGNVPVGADTMIVVRNASGLTRSTAADANGRYSIGTLPVGRYTVTVERGGEVVGTREVTVLAGAGADVSFVKSGGGTLDVVTVTGTSLPAIDTTAVDTRSVVTSDQLERLPLARSAEAVALLAPGAVSGASGYFGNLVSFGGAGVSENAYYVNGYFTGEPLSNLGGFTLPYGSIEQQETFIGGYSAMYGRSAGGVISQIGKRGTNEWHFGGQVTYTPKALRGKKKDLYFPNIDLTGANANPDLPSTCEDANKNPVLCQWAYADASRPGTLYHRGKDETSWGHSYSLYASGPIVRDRLFFFASGEWEESRSNTTPTALDKPQSRERTTQLPKFYGKLDWNITDNHLLELSFLSEKTDRSGTYYSHDFSAGAKGNRLDTPDAFVQKNQFAIAKYTGYLTENLTFSATYGRGKLSKQENSVIPGLARVDSHTLQNPAIVGNNPISSRQADSTVTDAENRTEGLRADLKWVLGDHTLTFGIDNIKFRAINEGEKPVVDRWVYGRAAGNISSTLGVGSPVGPGNPNGYFVRKLVFSSQASMSLEQRAWYIEDRWQATDRLLLSLGLRNDKFTNRNDVGAIYLDAKNQWAPRLGFAWDVRGDASMKVFGNAGRYFLAMPNNVAIRGASTSTYTNEYFTYTGVDANGVPTGLTPVPRLDGGRPRPVSSNGEYGMPVDVLAFAPSDLKNMYQDEYILGFENMLNDKLMLGVKLTRRDLKSAVDDVCDPYTFMARNGLNPIKMVNGKYIAQGGSGGPVEVAYCYMFNPGGTNTFSLANTDADGKPTGGRTQFTMSSEDWGFQDRMKRRYNALDIYLERPFDGKWEGRIDYTFSKSSGNMEGQVKSEFGQSNISKTQDWDAAQIMAYAYGYLANDRRHQLKARGSYQLTDELMLSGSIRIMSGAPISCLGYFNPDGSINENTSEADPIGYEAAYRTCFGQIVTPGSRRTSWSRTLDLGLTYRPHFFDKKLALGMQVRNVLNAQETLQVNVTSESKPYVVSNTYMMPIGRQTPRTVVFTAAYNW